MKLRTEMQNGCVHANGYCVDEDAVDIRQAERLVHDTAVAHALMEAITAWGKHPGYQGGESWVKKRAGEIMAGWGFDSGEND